MCARMAKNKIKAKKKKNKNKGSKESKAYCDKDCVEMRTKPKIF